MFSSRVFYCSLIGLLFYCSGTSALNDPTRPSAYRSVGVSAKPLNLESILISDERRVAVINGSVVAEGDSVGSAKVIAIETDSVSVSSGGKTARLTLESASIRQEK